MLFGTPENKLSDKIFSHEWENNTTIKVKISGLMSCSA